MKTHVAMNEIKNFFQFIGFEAVSATNPEIPRPSFLAKIAGICRSKNLLRRLVGSRLSQAGNVAVTDKRWLQSALSVFFRARDCEIKHTNAEARFALINASIACAYHDPISGLLFAAKVDHGMRNWRIALNRISAGPEKQVAGLEILEFKRIVLHAQDRLELAGPTEPNILLARIARNAGDVILLEHIINESRAIHAAIGWIRRAIFVIELSSS